LVDCRLVGEGFRPWEAPHSPRLRLVLENKQIGRIYALWIQNTAIYLGHSHQFGPSISEKLRGPIAHISKPLNDESFAEEAEGNPKSLCHFWVGENLFGGVEDAEASRLGPAADASQFPCLSRGDCIGVDVIVAEVALICRFHPVHFSLAGSQVGPGDVY